MQNNGREREKERREKGGESCLKVGHHMNMRFVHVNLQQKLKLHVLMHDDIITQRALIGRRCEKSKVTTDGRKCERKSKSLFSVHLHFLPHRLEIIKLDVCHVTFFFLSA